MVLRIDSTASEVDPQFKLFHELMRKKIREILLISSLYDACILEEDGQLAEKINHEYRGLNLSHPPRLTWASSTEEALRNLAERDFDMVIAMPRLADMNTNSLVQRIKEECPSLPFVILTHTVPDPLRTFNYWSHLGIRKVFMWSGNIDLLLALIKHVEDEMNVADDTRVGGVRVILCVEDSPVHLSRLLPALYKQVMMQTRAVIEQGLNEEHKLVTMRARPKILVARNFEEAADLYQSYRPYLSGIISDVRFPRKGELDGSAGISFLSRIGTEAPNIPLLLASSEPANKEKATDIQAVFLDKNSAALHAELHSFLVNHLGFGDFVFRLPNGKQIARASDMHSFEKTLSTLPLASFSYHWDRNDFSRWLFARSEIILASRVQSGTEKHFTGDMEHVRQLILNHIRGRRRQVQKAVVVSFNPHGFDPEIDLLKIGRGSIGGKARGLVFLSNLLARHPERQYKFPGVSINLPQTLVITTEGFDSFIELNNLKGLSKAGLSESVIADLFRTAEFPDWIEENLKVYLAQVNHPLAVRSSSLLEDHQCQPYAGLYRTYMIPNDHSDLETRLQQLTTAIKLVYASTYFPGPRSFARRTSQHIEEEKMAIIIQRLVGRAYGGYFYPAISGVAQSYNYYPISPMKAEDGVTHMALGLGRTIMEGGRALRFSPRHPQVLPQFSSVEDVLKNSQHTFYALKLGDPKTRIEVSEESTLERRAIADAAEEDPVRLLSSTYIPDENAIRDGCLPGPKVLTFSQILKYGSLPLPQIIAEFLDLCEKGMHWPVEIEFSVNISDVSDVEHQFALLQVRPMGAHGALSEVQINDDEAARALCFSSHALGNGVKRDLADIIYVKPEVFTPSRMREMAREIGAMNARLALEGRRYLLVGPGRWGSADRWLGIPVQWADICGVGAIVETTADGLNVEPSQGSHFFHNITTLGIDYAMIMERAGDFFDWNWLQSQSICGETSHIAHVQLHAPLYLKSDGRNSRFAIFDHSCMQG